MVSHGESIWEKVAEGDRAAIRSALQEPVAYAGLGESDWAEAGVRSSLHERFQRVALERLVPEIQHALRSEDVWAAARAAGLVADLGLIACQRDVLSRLQACLDEDAGREWEGYVTDAAEGCADLAGWERHELLRAAARVGILPRPALERSVFDGNPAVRELASAMLSQSEPERSVGILLEALRELPGGPLERSFRGIGAALEQALRAEPDTGFLDALLAGIDGEGCNTRQAARRGLVGLLGDAAVRRGVDDEWLVDILALVASGLENAEDDPAEPVLICDALADLGDDRAVPFLMARLRKLGGSDPNARKADLLRAVRRLTGVDRGEAVESWVDWWNETKR